MVSQRKSSVSPAAAFIAAARRAVAIICELDLARLANPFTFPADACMDKAVATVEFTETSFRFVVDRELKETLDHLRFERVDYDDTRGWDLGDCGLLVMILESPHKGEFANRQAIAPAQGTTGRNIGKYLRLQHQYLPGLKAVARGRYRLVLMNAIQYQCSLGEETKIFRDLIFRNLWLRFGREDFICRLRNTWRALRITW